MIRNIDDSELIRLSKKPLQLYKRAITFAACPTGSPNLITVSIKPDPPLANQPAVFTISGTIKTGVIDTGSKLVISAVDNSGNILGEPLIDDIYASRNTLGCSAGIVTGTN
ncbi:hypothetical protein RhiirA4_460285 [Rhizophagus irregularis]|uniref:Uncharacterized protein n=1 Tax=Rhizophagus irregularis TaxID=588596 RepID=A0A2I1GG96_9GLOM|nr:hypothetical protein RhiirA4_460285 [Rhizophagus irregularis]